VVTRKVYLFDGSGTSSWLTLAVLNNNKFAIVLVRHDDPVHMRVILQTELVRMSFLVIVSFSLTAEDYFDML